MGCRSNQRDIYDQITPLMIETGEGEVGVTSVIYIDTYKI